MAQKHGGVANKHCDPSGFPIIAVGFNRRECSCKRAALFAQARMAFQELCQLAGGSMDPAHLDDGASTTNLSVTGIRVTLTVV